MLLRRDSEVPRRTPSRAGRFPTLTVLVVIASIGIVGALYVRSEQRQLQEGVEAQLAAIADLKVSQIAAWRGERLADAAGLAGLLADRIRSALGRPEAAQSALGPTLRLVAASYGYSDVLVIDAQGRALATAGEAEPPPTAQLAAELATALQEGPTVAEMAWGGRPSARLHFVAPVLDPDRPGLALGGVVLRVDPRRVLFPMVERWPTPSATGEALLVRVQGSSIVALNELRHRRGDPPFTLPLDDLRYPGARVARGEAGLVRGIDYRGVEVLAVGRAVPRSPWLVIAKVDAREILAPARQWSIALGAVVFLLIGSGVGAVALWWRHQAALDERTRFEEAQRRQAIARHLELLSEHADDVVLMVDFAGRIVRANERTREQYGWSVAELVGQELRVLRAPGHESVQEHLLKIRTDGRARYETVHRRRDGSTFPVEVSARRFEAEGAEYFQAIVRDATERKRVLAELSHQAEMLRNVYDGVIGLDAGHVVRFWNGGAERMYGIRAADAIGRPIPELLPSEYKGYASWREFVADVNGGDRVEFEVRRRLPDGRELDVEGAGVVLRDAERRITGYVTVNRDVTERRRAREQLFQAQKMEAVGQLASGVAHDFNNLLVGILSCSGFLLESLDPADPSRPDVEEIRQAGQRAAHLVRQLLTFARKDPARSASAVELDGVVRGLEPLLRRTIGEHIELSFSLDPCQARIDPGHLEQVLLNLAVNARDAMPGGGRLRVETRSVAVGALPVGTSGLARGRYALLTVADTGCGIPPEVLPRIFEPFFTTKGAGRGTGLGLSTAYAIVQDAAGRIAVDSEPGRGTRFSVYLPAAGEHGAARPPPPAAPARGGRGRTVLVVEDEELVRRVVRRTLEGAGYAVLEAAGVDEALATFRGGPAVDLVLSDVVMPGRSGVDLAAELEALRPDVPVVLMSGYSEWQRASSDARRLLDKPFTSDALLARIAEELREPPVPARAPSAGAA
jgi:PAS domain S-box-containing protein